MRISAQGLAFIKQEERFMARRYLCPTGKPTIGYGHVILPGEERYHTAVLTEAQASTLLQQDIDQKYGAHVAGRVHRDLSQNQFDALVSLCYNIGTAGFDKSSVLALANAGATDHKVLVNAFGLWNKVTNPRTRIKEISKGLTIRRAREAALYLS